MRFLFKLPLIRVLSHRPIFVLWLGEAFSAIGDEIYKVALVWLTVKLIGADAGYIAAAQAGTILLLGLIGGKWADHWDSQETMLWTDIARAVLVLIPVIWVYFFSLNLPLLFFVAIAVAALNAFFEPALQEVVPRLVPDPELLQATNGLMGTTNRLARAVGPTVVGALTGLIPVIHFFTLDALSFGASAWAIVQIRKNLPAAFIRRIKKNSGVLSEMQSGLLLIRRDAQIQYILVAKAIASGFWSIVLPLGIAMLVQELFPGNVRVYGLLLAAYGAGNLGGAVYLSNVVMRRPMLVMALGFLLMGLSFVAMTANAQLPLMIVFIALSAIGGPMNDLAHIHVIQKRYPVDQLVRIMRLRMAIEYGGIFFCLCLAPVLFQCLSARWVIALSGVIIASVGVVGFLYFREGLKRQ